MTLSFDSNVAAYKGYRGLPPLAGLLSMQEALHEGLPVLTCAERLKRIHWALKAMHHVLLARLASMPIYELKMAFSLHAHLCAEHVESMAHRIREMRQPPYGLDGPPAPELQFLEDEILASDTIEPLLLGIYGVLLPASVEAVGRILRETNRLFDHPTYRICRLAELELSEAAAYGKQALQALVSDEQRVKYAAWVALLQQALAAAGGLDNSATPVPTTLSPHYSRKAFVYDGTPRRDERFQDPYNMGVHAEAMLFDPSIPALPKTLMLYFKRMREIDVPEMMSSILVQTSGKPWAYYRDMTRQLWDEARHAMMGEVGFVSLGLDWTKVPLNITWSKNLNTRLTPLERHAVLYAIEQGLMPKKTGKEYEWEVAVASASPLAQAIQDYDWADEILHARIGRDWLTPAFGSQQAALAFGDEAWSRAVSGWSDVLEQGLTQHRNWWPELYAEACRTWCIEPDPSVLRFHVTYENARPDQKELTA